MRVLGLESEGFRALDRSEGLWTFWCLGQASAAERAGYRTLRLGPRVLRTETAAVAALGALQAHWGDLA